MLNHEIRRVVYTGFYFVAVVFFGVLLHIWLKVEPFMHVPLLIWVVTWLNEYHLFRLSFPRYRRDWIAHVGGVSSALLGLALWFMLKERYPFVLNIAFQLAYTLFILLVQDGITYILSSREYRKVVRRLYRIPKPGHKNESYDVNSE